MEYSYEAEAILLQSGTYNLDPYLVVYILDPRGNVRASHTGGSGSGRIDSVDDGAWSIMLVNFETSVKFRVLIYLHLLPTRAAWPLELSLLAVVSAGLLGVLAHGYSQRGKGGRLIEPVWKTISGEDWVERSWRGAGILVQKYA
ncbi:MAG: hypothetical protein GTO63_20910 [Anaerolineae bacterium]|nr:hypothetical protein [Anaerolineae bacterium]NIN97241.1 hypothetical protein [Anaerolineae bacterium]